MAKKKQKNKYKRKRNYLEMLEESKNLKNSNEEDNNLKNKYSTKNLKTQSSIKESNVKEQNCFNINFKYEKKLMPSEYIINNNENSRKSNNAIYPILLSFSKEYIKGTSKN